MGARTTITNPGIMQTDDNVFVGKYTTEGNRGGTPHIESRHMIMETQEQESKKHE